MAVNEVLNMSEVKRWTGKKKAEAELENSGRYKNCNTCRTRNKGSYRSSIERSCHFEENDIFKKVDRFKSGD